MVAMRPGAEQIMMVEVNFRQGREGTVLETTVQDLYLCASMEFLLTVADIFLEASQKAFSQKPQQKSLAGSVEKKTSSVKSKEPSKLAGTFVIDERKKYITSKIFKFWQSEHICLWRVGQVLIGLICFILRLWTEIRWI